jgi:hypothetical protein
MCVFLTQHASADRTSQPEDASIVGQAPAKLSRIQASRHRCSHGLEVSMCGLCRPCPHGNGQVKLKCILCFGACEHGKLKRNCAKCDPCPHGKRRYFCVECNPCPHGRLKHDCKQCSGCPHEKLRRRCKLRKGKVWEVVPRTARPFH